jgi:Tol biopolymer transport system component
MNPDGSGQQKLTDLDLWWYPEWSPDGSTIAFTAGTPANTEIYTIRPDGSGLSNITNDPAPDYLGSWGP